MNTATSSPGRFGHGAWLRVAVVLCALALAAPTPAMAEEDQAAAIRSALDAWTEDFNAGRADKVCDLFAKELHANVRGFPERGYEAQCELLKKSLADETRSYRYAHAIKEILVYGDAAVVRLVWTLTIMPRDGPAQTSIEPGLDVFEKQPDGKWRIIRYLAYEE